MGIQAALDSYAENGGPRLDMKRAMRMCDTQVAQMVTGLARNVMVILKDIKSKVWPDIKDLNDERIRASWNAWAHGSMYKNGLLIYQQLEGYKNFQEWKRENDLPAHKS